MSFQEAGQHTIVRGSPLTIRAYLEGEARGIAPAGIAGDEAVSASLGRGDGTPAVATLAAEWDAMVSLPDVAVLVSLSASDSAELTPGQYRVFLTVGSATRAIAWVVVQPGVGADDRPPTYVDAAEWRKIARPMLAAIGMPFDDGGIDAALGQARADLDGVLSDWYVASWPGDHASSAARDRVAGWLAAGALGVTPRVRRYCVFRAAFLLLAFSPGTKDSSLSLARVRDECKAEYEAALRGLVVYLSPEGGDPVRLSGRVAPVRFSR